MKPTTLVYSSHNCSPYLHREWIVERALENPYDKRLLYLPMSEWPVQGDAFESQKFGWDKVAWYFNQFRHWGLRPQPFYWSEHLSRHDIGLLFELLENAPVVILGGGNTRLGMARYRALGYIFNGDADLFCTLLHQRQARGQLTVGYSAGADQLGSVFGGAMWAEGAPCDGLGMARDVAVTLHHEWGREHDLWLSATNIRHCAWFGLPNDSALAVNQGVLPTGLVWQLIQFITDNSWDIPSDHHHIKTRQGMKIDHFYPDGRHWAFSGGEAMLRLMTMDGSSRRGWLLVNGGIYGYESQRPAPYRDMWSILEDYSRVAARR